MGQTPPTGTSGQFSVAKVIAVGILGGVLAGLFGVGGGIVMVPLFVFLLGLDQRTAVTTSLLAIIPISALGTIGYATGGAVAWTDAVVIGLGSIVGGQIGVRLLHRIPIPALQAGFAALLFFSAYRLVLPSATASTPGDGQWWLLVLLGVAAGMLAGLLGVGGGIVIVPGLVLLASTSLDVARGTSLLVVLLTAVTASFTTVRGGQTATKVGVWAGLAGAPASLAAARFAQWIPERQAAVLFAGLMVLAGVQLVRRAMVGSSRRANTEGG
ncbi:MAG: sulfite exporter TauE/SafE family protein [Candidatus Nanopelagicales bacterium]